MGTPWNAVAEGAVGLRMKVAGGLMVRQLISHGLQEGSSGWLGVKSRGGQLDGNGGAAAGSCMHLESAVTHALNSQL
jgi:hypothetical protein